MKTKWIASLGMTTMLVGSVLAGCSGSDEKASSNGGENGQKVEIVFAGWGGNPTEQKLLNQTIPDFERSIQISM